VGIPQAPQPYQRGDYLKLSDQSAFWAYQRLDTLSLIRYRDIHKDIRSALDPIEEEAFGAQASIEKKAAALFKSNPLKARAVLTRYVENMTLKAEHSARELFDTLSAKYRDGLPETTLGEDRLKILSQR
jgi:dipeptidase